MHRLRRILFLLLATLAQGCATLTGQPSETLPELPPPSAVIEEVVSAPFVLEQATEVFAADAQTVSLPSGDYVVTRIDAAALSIAAVDGEAQVIVNADPVESTSADLPGVAYVVGEAANLEIRYSWREGDTVRVPLSIARVKPRSVDIAASDLTVRITGPAEIPNNSPTEFRVFVKNVGAGTARNFEVRIWTVDTLDVRPARDTKVRDECNVPYAPVGGYYQMIGCRVAELGGGQEIWFDFTLWANFRVINEGGNQKIYRADVDHWGAVAETNESNNRQVRTVTFQ